MADHRRHRLIETDWPSFGESGPPPKPSVGEFDERIRATRSAMERLHLTHLVVYGDPEHFANLTYLTGFDPRFEESLLIIPKNGDPLVVVGNECADYLSVSPLYAAEKLRRELYQSFSLLNMPRERSRFIKQIFQDEGIGRGSSVGCVGWKYYSDSEHPDSRHAIELPSFLVDTLRELAGRENVVNATSVFMNPNDGLRTQCSSSEIAYFEYTNILASEGAKRMIFGLRDGMIDYDLARLMEYNGEPLGCRPTLVGAANKDRPLSGPVGAVIHRGDPLAFNISYWGSNICRAGWVASSAADLPHAARDYVEKFAGPYFEAMNDWFAHLRIGTRGSDLYRIISERLPFGDFGIYLNPGHLSHLDEGMSSPIYSDSTDRIHSGMMIQTDVIPFSSTYFSTRMEDAVIIADRDLRDDLQEQFPECYSRCVKRRAFMTRVLGIDLPEEILPLSNIPAIVPPFFLSPRLMLAMEGEGK
jgi:Xaa-Pro aminopeptidase